MICHLAFWAMHHDDAQISIPRMDRHLFVSLRALDKSRHFPSQRVRRLGFTLCRRSAMKSASEEMYSESCSCKAMVEVKAELNWA